jgi:uncharacterized protein GlcG (DUF336 family)
MLTLRQANTIIESALSKARELSLRPLAVVVVDSAGNIVAAQREDGATMFQFDVALGKAWGSVAMRSSSRALANRAKANPNFFLTLASTANGKLVPQTGAVLIRDASGAILGAAGASGGGHGGDEDEACCVYGVEEAGLQPDASA